MTQKSITIENTPLPYPGMDFKFLCKEGMTLIRKMAGYEWTDHNTHDPGITILEHLCYAITDLSYRLCFNIEELLAYPADQQAASAGQFFTAADILPVNPLTVNDYRKLLIDIEGVKNAWLEPLGNTSPTLYYDSETNTVAFKPLETGDCFSVNGLYRVMVERDTRLTDLTDKELQESILRKLHSHRNLCEDFYEINILPQEVIILKAEMEIDDNENAESLLAKVIYNIERFISPSIIFQSLNDLFKQGKTVDEIFSGPLLDNGFIDDDELERFERKSELHVSDIIRIILNNKSITNIKDIKISSDQSTEYEQWVLKLSPDHSQILTDIDTIISKNYLRFYKSSIPCQVDFAKVEAELDTLRDKSDNAPGSENNDFPIPTGMYRNLSEYETIQNDFPPNYGIGETGLPGSVSEKRKAQAKQLKGYLMFFDQILADYFSQLDHAKNILSFSDNHNNTYISGIIENMTGMQEILTARENLQEDEKSSVSRKNKMADHLLSIFSEKFTDYAFLMYDSEQSGYERLVQKKYNLLKSYPRISANRLKASDYREKSQIQDERNISGLKDLITAKLGLSDIEKDFIIVEHLLLRPDNDTGSQFETVLSLKNTETDNSTNTIIADPFSFTITYVFPDWPFRFRDESFRLFLYDSLAAETPAHISFKVIWMDKVTMENFKNEYYNWLTNLDAGAGTNWKKAKKMYEFLEIGTIK